jgi:hypothetical protein
VGPEVISSRSTDPPDLAALAVAAENAAAARRASGVMSADSAEQITVITVETSDRPSAVAVALAVASEALRCPPCHPASERTTAARCLPVSRDRFSGFEPAGQIDIWQGRAVLLPTLAAQ